MLRPVHFTFCALLLPACQATDKSASGISEDESPSFTCSGPDELDPTVNVSIEIFSRHAIVVDRFGQPGEQRVRHDIADAPYVPRTEAPRRQCGTVAGRMVINVFADALQASYFDGTQLQWLQFNITGPGGDGDGEQPIVWKTIDRDAYDVYYAEGREADGRQIDAYMAHAVQAMRDEFKALDPEAVLRGITRFDVYVQPKPTDSANDGTALLTATLTEGRLDFLAPSAHTSGVRDNLASYIQKTIIHEYGTMFLQWYPASVGGWQNLYTAPGWFVQGYEEYLGLIHGDDHSRRVTLKRYLDEYKADRSSIRIDAAGIVVTNDYYDGTVLLHFLYETYGQARVQQVLTSPKATFDDALAASIGSYAKIAADFAVWSAAL